MTSYTTTGCLLQGGQVLSLDSRLEVRDSLQAIIHRFPLADFGAISDQGEFYQRFSLGVSTPSILLDESLTGYSGATALMDVDLVYISTTAPILVEIASGIPLNSVTPGSRNPYGSVYDVNSVLLLKSNHSPTITLEADFDQRVLPLKFWIANNIDAADVTVYMAKFSQ